MKHWTGKFNVSEVTWAIIHIPGTGLTSWKSVRDALTRIINPIHFWFSHLHALWIKKATFLSFMNSALWLDDKTKASMWLVYVIFQSESISKWFLVWQTFFWFHLVKEFQIEHFELA